MLRRPSRSALGPLRFHSLSCRRSFPPWHRAFPRLQSTSSADHEPAHEPAHDPETQDDHAPDRRSRFTSRNSGEKFELEVDSLGKPGEIIVVPHSPRRRIPQPKSQVSTLETAEEDTQKSTLLSMLDDLESEQLIPSESSVKERIEHCRRSYQPKERLSAREWENIRFDLEFSFTYRQLVDYIEKYMGDASILEPGAWKPGLSTLVDANALSKERITERSAADRVSDDITGRTSKTKYSKSLRGKALLAERILRDCWHMSVTDEIGQLEFQMPSQFISLLLHAGQFSLAEVANLHDVRIDTTHSLGLVKVTGKQVNCEPVRDIILDAASRIQKEDVGLGPHAHKSGSGQPFTPYFLEWVNKTYGVVIQHEASGSPKKILYLAENKSGADDARRTLNLAIYETSFTPIPFSTYVPASQPASTYNFSLEATASWYRRQKPWFRWAMSSAQSAEAEEIETPLFENHQTRLSDQLLKLLRDVPAANPIPQGGVNIHESVTAAVGRCLFMQKSSFEEMTLSASQLGKMILPRAFTTDIPRMTVFIDSLSPVPPRDKLQSYHIRLTPPAIHAGVFPELDIEVTVNPTRNDSRLGNGVEVRSVKAILTTNSVDYLLPENGLDLRFTRTVSRELLDASSESPSHHEMVQSIKQSLRDLFARGHRGPVPVPAFCQVSLPTDIFASPDSANNNASMTEKDTSDESLESTEPETNTTVEYMLPPLRDIRATASQQYDFDGRPLNYRFYESGPFLAAHTTEVSLGMGIPRDEPVLGNDSSPGPLDQEFHSFYTDACDLAFQIHRTKAEN